MPQLLGVLITQFGQSGKQADTEGHIAIIMPRPEDWLKASKTLLTFEQYRERREVSSEP